jgi:hypothetical protein
MEEYDTLYLLGFIIIAAILYMAVDYLFDNFFDDFFE